MPISENGKGTAACTTIAVTLTAGVVLYVQYVILRIGELQHDAPAQAALTAWGALNVAWIPAMAFTAYAARSQLAKNTRCECATASVLVFGGWMLGELGALALLGMYYGALSTVRGPLPVGETTTFAVAITVTIDAVLVAGIGTGAIIAALITPTAAETDPIDVLP